MTSVLLGVPQKSQTCGLGSPKLFRLAIPLINKDSRRVLILIAQILKSKCLF